MGSKNSIPQIESFLTFGSLVCLAGNQDSTCSFLGVGDGKMIDPTRRMDRNLCLLGKGTIRVELQVNAVLAKSNKRFKQLR